MRMPHGPLRLVAAMVAAGLLVVGPVVPASAAASRNLLAGEGDPGERLGGRVPGVGRQRRRPGHLLGKRRQQLPAVGARRPRHRHERRPDRPEGARAGHWQTRTQTLSVQGSADGSTYSTVVASADYTFNPATGNKVTISFGAAAHRYWRINVTANTGWPAAQISEFEVYGAASGGDDQAPTAPSNLAYTQPAAGQIRLTWNASTDNVGVTGYDIYANGQLRAGVGTVLTYTDTQPATATVSYFVRARDGAGNLSRQQPVTRTGTAAGTNLAQGKAIVESGHVHIRPGQRQRRQVGHLLGGAPAVPENLTVKLGANADLTAVVVKLNPDPVLGHPYPEHPGPRPRPERDQLTPT